VCVVKYTARGHARDRDLSDSNSFSCECDVKFDCPRHDAACSANSHFDSDD
jgi:hypothetical protein